MDIHAYLCRTPLLNPKEVYKKIPSKRPMGYDKGDPNSELLLFERKLSLKF